MGRRGGGIAQRDREGRQDIQTHPAVAQVIMSYLWPHLDRVLGPFTILDACAGDGVLGKAFHLPGISKLYCVDVYPKADDVERMDVMDIARPTDGFDVIICNPPWREKDAVAIWNHLQYLLSSTGVLFFLINNVFCYQGIDRAAGLDYQKYYFLPRYVYMTSGKDLLDCGIMVCHKDGIVPEAATKLKPFISIRKEDIVPVHIKDIAEEFDLKQTEVQAYIDCFLDQGKVYRKRMEEDVAKTLRGFIELYVRGGQRSADYLGKSKQRFYVLMEAHGVKPIQYGERIAFYLKADIDRVNGLIQTERQKNI